MTASTAIRLIGRRASYHLTFGSTAREGIRQKLVRVHAAATSAFFFKVSGPLPDREFESLLVRQQVTVFAPQF